MAVVWITLASGAQLGIISLEEQTNPADVISHAAPHSIAGADLPDIVWKADTLSLPVDLSDAHRAECSARGWLHEYSPASEGAGPVGGTTAADAKLHFLNRFLNSAARSQYVCSDPRDECPEVRDMILDQLGEGRICILDLAAGHGAGTLSILALLSTLRATDTIPKLPLNVEISGLDFSPDALSLYTETLHRLLPSLNAQGIDVKLSCLMCDLTMPADVSETLDGFFDEATKLGVTRFLCVLSAISGIGKEGMEAVHDSLKLVAARLGSRRRQSSWLWLEPSGGKHWFTAFMHSVTLVMRRIKHTFRRTGATFDVETEFPLAPETVRHFKWIDPYTAATVNSHVVVVEFSNQWSA